MSRWLDREKIIKFIESCFEMFSVNILSYFSSLRDIGSIPMIEKVLHL